LLTEVLAPAPTVTVLVLVIAGHSASTVAEAVRVGGLALLFTSLLPFLYILRGVRRRRLTDHHISERAQRPLPLLIGLGSMVVGLLVLAATGAPRELVALIGSMAVTLAAATAITLAWKISLHVAVAGGTLAVLALVFGPVALVFAPAVALLAWARVETGAHDLAQVLAGAVLGSALGGLTFALLR
jgi:hypothetical protein